MNNTHLDQAREWAETVKHYDDTYGRGENAAAEVINALPDRWIDAEKVAELADDMANWSLPDVPSTTEIDYRRLVEIMDGFTERINDLLAPPLPTLAGMTPEERKACRWMQARTWHEVGIILWVDEASEIAQLITRANGVLERKFKDVTPLPGEPKLEWPGSHADTITAESVEDVQAGRVADFEPALPRPEDVPAGEPWIVLCGGRKWVGVRSADSEYVPWGILRMDGLDNHDVSDSDITLMSRLVPEDKP